MSLFDWLRKKQTGDASSDLVIKPEENEFAGLDLKQVLDAHMAWRKRLERILAGDASEAVEVAQVAPDNLCMLGKWLHGTGKQQFLRFPEYGSLLLTHRDFHLTAGQILIEHSEGNAEVASRLLTHDFRSLSGRIQLDLVRLYAAVN